MYHFWNINIIFYIYFLVLFCFVLLSMAEISEILEFNKKFNKNKSQRLPKEYEINNSLYKYNMDKCPIDTNKNRDFLSDFSNLKKNKNKNKNKSQQTLYKTEEELIAIIYNSGLRDIPQDLGKYKYQPPSSKEEEKMLADFIEQERKYHTEVSGNLFSNFANQPPYPFNMYKPTNQQII